MYNGCLYLATDQAQGTLYRCNGSAWVPAALGVHPDQLKVAQDLYLEGKKGESAGAVPDALVDEVALVGPKERIADGLQRWREAGVDTLIVGTFQIEALQALAEAAL